MKKQRTVYYKSEKDDFFEIKDSDIKIDGSYKYVNKSVFSKIKAFILYRIVATPLAFLYTRIKFKERYIGKEKLKPYKKTGYFIYANHTQPIGDALSPNVLVFPKKLYVVVNKENLALPVIKKATVSLGALPLPDDLRAARNFSEAISERLDKGCAVAIYPEAHVWPYYTGIRDFDAAALEPAMKNDVPVFTLTRVYKKRRFGKKPRCELYVDGPFFKDPSLPKRQSREDLKTRLYSAMAERAATSDVEFIKYVKTDEKEESCQAEP